ncbi:MULTISPECIES: glycosyltransferase [unclassified Polaromonas]|uniref:glycosyltransferase n=1 Tax=unclassified Polaromonas TaxID=2638319 RepID=UPI000F08A579|nr:MULTISPECIES: glycosyltransferase [unclassified Polaromonas]AYQ27917.1 glycosyltransferase family 4 protein [Polaromonas sp. SP1]QGJ17222.1 glycosyltransferase [Polaromonas sp. Pch-P]
MKNPTPKTHLSHEWLTEWGGSEDVTRLMLDCLPGSSLSATINFLSAENRARLNVADIQTTFLQRAPFIEKRFWNYLPLTPLAVESLDLRDADLVISSSHAFAKGVLTTAQQLHISYVHSPMRYAWDLHHQYLADYKLDRGLKGLLARYMFHRLRLWDRQTANNVDLFLANSRHVQQRIWRTYRRPSRVLYPPVRIDSFKVQEKKDDFYVTVSRLVSYKRVDLIVDAFVAMPSRHLVVIGDGPEASALKQRCPANVTLLGWQPDDVVEQYLGSAKAFIFAAHEDFGISPVEAQACGTPVIAYGVGGAAETVCDVRQSAAPTGLLFHEQTATALVDAVEDFERVSGRISVQVCRAWAEKFSENAFRQSFTAVVNEAWDCWKTDPESVEPKILGPISCS